MGYRSTFVTDDQSLKLPAWFVEKWHQTVYINPEHTLPIASKQEMKAYGHWAELPYDLQRVIKEANDGWARCVHFVFLHEDGLVTRINIYADHFEDENEQDVFP